MESVKTWETVTIRYKKNHESACGSSFSRCFPALQDPTAEAKCEHLQLSV